MNLAAGLTVYLMCLGVIALCAFWLIWDSYKSKSREETINYAISAGCLILTILLLYVAYHVTL